MNIKLCTVITILSLTFFFGFDKISYSLNKITEDNIAELKILNYLPKDNKIFFISNSHSSKIANDLRKNYITKDQEKISLIGNSILGFLGIDLGTNKLEDVEMVGNQVVELICHGLITSI